MSVSEGRTEACDEPVHAHAAAAACQAPENDRWALLGAIAIVLLALAYGSAFFPLRFETNDDVAMLGIARGFFGNEIGEPRLINQSAFIGLLIGSLFRVAANVDWYSLFQWGACLASISVIAFVWLRRSRHPLSLFALAFVATAFFAPILFELQFTKTSLLCIAAAVVLLLDMNPEERLRGRAAGVLFFALLGTMIRSVNQRAGVALLLAAIVYAASEALMRGRDRASVARLAALQGGLVVAFLFGANAIEWAEERIFYSEPDWQEFWQHRGDRAYVIDNWPREIGRARIAAEIEAELGVTPEQYAALMRWIPIDEKTYSSATFASIAGVVRALETRGVDSSEAEAATGGSLAEEAARFAEWLLKRPEILHAVAFMLVFAGCIGWLSRSARLRAAGTGLFWSALLVGLLFGIHAIYRAPPHRVWMPLLALIFTANAFSLIRSGAREAQRRGSDGGVPDRRELAAIAVVLLIGLFLFPVHRDFLARSQAAQDKRVFQCGLTDLHIRALGTLPKESRIFMAPQVVSSECLISPMKMDFPAFLDGRLVAFGWRNLTPWSRNAFFGEQSDLIDLMCREPGHAFVLNPHDFETWRRYLARHRPDARFSHYAEGLPPAILKCEIASPLRSVAR